MTKTNNEVNEMTKKMTKLRVSTDPANNPPLTLIRAMATAGAVVEEVSKGHHLVRVSDVDSEAWGLYKEWSLGKTDLLVMACIGPTPEIAASCAYPALLQYRDIQYETTSIIHQMASIADSQAVELPGKFSAPMVPAKFCCGEVAVSALPHAISNPGPNYPVIDAMHAGHYICHLHYKWHGGWITVPVFRS